MTLLQRFEAQLEKLPVEQKEKYQKAIDSLVPDLIEPVKGIENSPKLTQHHYGRYLNILLQFDRKLAMLYGVALIKAGANEKGVVAAIKYI